MASSRRFIAGLVRLGLVVLAIALCVRFIMHRVPRHTQSVRMQAAVPATDSLGPGDVRIYNADSAIDLVLMGDKVLTGLSPKTVAKIKGELDTSAMKDTNGFGGSIAQIVKKSVAGAIGTHASFPVSDIRDVRYQNGGMVFEWKDGAKHEIFGGTNVNGQKVSNTFTAEEANRFIDAFRARKKELGG